MKDLLGRGIDYLRVSVTDRCNLRCVYCMPADGVEPMAHADILTYEEILQVCRCAAALGVKSIKLTGGEPLVRRGLPALIKSIKQLPGIRQVTLTSNGLLLGDALPQLAAAGLDAVNISLDTLDPMRYAQITRGQGLERVLSAIDTALEHNIAVKINCVPIREHNGGELAQLAALARERPIDVRFIELMPIGCGKAFTPVPSGEIRQLLREAFGEPRPCAVRRGNGPAQYISIPGFRGNIGFIDAISGCFCAQCNRIRLTSSGFLKLCLHHSAGVDLREPMRAGLRDDALTELMRRTVLQKPERQQFGGAVGDEDTRMMSQIGG